VELQGRLEELRNSGIGVAGISYDSQETLADFTKRHSIGFPLLSDVGSATIKRYGILNTVVEEALGPNGKDPAVRADLLVYATNGEPAERFRGIPFPGTFMLDRQGRVTSRFFEDYYWERNTVANVLLRLGAGSAPVQAMQASTAHLDVQTYPSDSTVSLGTRFTLALEIMPKRGMHVYAPGAKGYRVITLNITPQPYVRTMPLRYPASEMYDFVPLNERVPVFQKPFKLLMDVVPEATAEARKGLAGRNELVINGTLEYQACDDKLCYNPVSVPLSWKVALQGLVPGASQPAQR
jgi:peroxiredoxin